MTSLSCEILSLLFCITVVISGGSLSLLYNVSLQKYTTVYTVQKYLFGAVSGCRYCTRTFFSFSRWGLLCICNSWASHCCDFSCCRTWGLEQGFQQLSCTGLVALQHVESSWTMNRTRVPCIGSLTTVYSFQWTFEFLTF